MAQIRDEMVAPRAGGRGPGDRDPAPERLEVPAVGVDARAGEAPLHSEVVEVGRQRSLEKVAAKGNQCAAAAGVSPWTSERISSSVRIRSLSFAR